MLVARGYEAVIEPLLTIRYEDAADLDLAGSQGVLITSANGARALARVTARRDVPVAAVGEASAQTARELGFTDVQDAGGDVAALATLAQRRFDPRGGSLLHVAGSVTAGDLSGRLEARGFTVVRRVLYEARPAAALSAALRTAIAAGEIDGVLLYSRRSAALFVALLTAAGLAGQSRRMTLLCLSPAVADGAGALSWVRVLVAAKPEQAALLALLDQVR